MSALSNNIIGEHNTAIGPNALKEHHQMQNLKAIVAEQQKQIEILTTGLQKVSAQLAAASPSVGALEASKFATGRIRRGGPAPQIANNP